MNPLKDPHKYIAGVIWICLVVTLFIGQASATTFTRSVDYSEDVREVTFKNWWGLGAEQGRVNLRSHEIDEKGEIITLKTGIGNQVTMYYDFQFNENLSDVLGDVEFINMKTGKPIDREWKYVYWFEEEREREVCSKYSETLTKNGTIEECSIYELEKYIYGEWRDYVGRNIKSETIRIGIMVNNKQGDYIDGIWNIGSKRLDRHAPWSASLNTDLVSYWTFDETSGTIGIDSLGVRNFTYTGATPNRAGKIGKAVDFDGTNDWANTTSTFNFGTGSFSVSGWWYADAAESNILFWNLGYDNSDSLWFAQSGSNYFIQRVKGGSNTGLNTGVAVTSGSWKHLTLVRDGTTFRFYIDGISVYNNTNSANDMPLNYPLQLGYGYPRAIGTYFNGGVDELGVWTRALTSDEINLQLYNGGTGNTYSDDFSLTINLTSPANNSFLTTANVNFIGEIITESNMTNVSLVVNNTIEQTNTSGVNGTYTFTETLSDGTYQWRIEGTTTENVSASSSNYTLTIDSTDPTLTASLNNTILYSEGETILLNTTATDTNLDSVWYSYNGINTTITGAVTGTLNQTTITTTLSALQIIVYANDTAGNTAEPVTFNLVVDPTSPTINLSYPTALIDYGKLNGTLELNFTATDTNLDSVWYIYGQLGHDTFESSNDGWTDGERSEVWSSQGNWSYKIIGGTFDSPIKYYSKSVNFDDIQGLYYDIKTTDTTSAYWTRISIDGDLIKEYNSSDTFLNEYINTSNITGVKDITFSLRGSSVGQSISYIDNIIYLGEGERIDIAGAVSGVYNQSNITLTTKKNVTIYANDTAGNLYSEVFGWDYRYFENNVSFNTPVLATSSQTFKLIGEKHSLVTSISGRLFYDGTPMISTIVTSGNNINLTNNFEIPAGTATRDFFWEITATTANGTFVFNTTSNTQTVQNITFTTCTVPTGLAYNFTTYDTETNLPLNSTFEATFSYYATGGTGSVLAEYNYQNLSENRSNYLFCLNSSGENVTIDAFISYGATGYDSRDYIIDDGTIGNFTVTIPLYLTQTLLTDVVTFTVEDQNYDRLAGALVTVQKWNVGTNTYSTIGMFTTSSSGTGIMDLELYNTWYRAIVTYQGVIVHVTDIQKLGSTDWPITVDFGVQNPYDLFGTISHGLVYDNETQIVTYSWSDSSGYVNTACMTVRRPTGSGYTDVYSDCTDSVAGSINYQFTENGTYEVYGIVYLTAEYEGISQVTDFMTITIGVPEIAQISSPYGKVISFVIIGTGGLAGVSLGSPILGIALIIGGLVGVSWMGWLKGVEAIMWSIISVAIVILARQSRKGS